MKRIVTTFLGAAMALVTTLASAHPGHDHSVSLHAEHTYPMGAEHLAILLLVVGCVALIARAHGKR